MYYVEAMINWRIAYFGFQFPHRNVELLPSSAVLPLSDSPIFIAQNPHFDILRLRDWLHEQAIDYTMTGCFQIQETGKMTLTGLHFSFISSYAGARFRENFLTKTADATKSEWLR